MIASLHVVIGQTPTPTPTETEQEIERLYSQGVALSVSQTPAGHRAAIEKYLAGIAVAEKARDKYQMAVGYVSVSRSYAAISDPANALKYAILCKDSAQTLSKTLQADALNQLALVYNDLGDHGKALEYLELERPLRQQEQDVPGEVGMLHNAAMIYNQLGDALRAKEIYEGILVYEQKYDAPPHILAATTNNLAYVYYKLENYRKAAELYNDAYVIGVKNEFEDVQAATLIGLGDSYNKLSDPAKAIGLYERGMALSIKVGNRIYEGDALFGLGVVYRAQGEKRRALEFLDRALLLQLAVGAREQASQTLATEMSVWVELNRNDVAILYGKQAINLNQQMRKNIKGLSKETQRLYVKSKEKAYRELSNVLIAEGRLPEAQSVLDLLKEQEYEQFVTLRSGESADTIPYSRAETGAMNKVENLASLSRLQNDLETSRHDKGSLSQTEQSTLTKILADIETANRELRMSLDSLAKAESSVGGKLGEIQADKNLQRALGRLRSEMNTGVVAIYTVIGTEPKSGNTDEHSKFGWAIMVTPEGRKAYPIDVTGLEDNVQQFRTVLRSAEYDPLPMAQKLYNAIFRQTSATQKRTLEQDLALVLGKYKDKTVMWSLDGVLRYVPMAALNDGKQYLTEKYRNTVFTKQSLLLLTEKDSPAWETLGLGVSEAKTIGGKNFIALDGAKRELTDIVRQPSEKTGILAGTRKMNGEFTKDATLGLLREGRYQAVHIASHFSFDPIDQTSSFLVIGDGKLSFADLQDKDNLFGSVDLLTLSACDTAMASNGKESEGFPFLAQSLGAKSVIASLWKVSDTGTPELMIRFYKLHADNPSMAKGEAFRQAQLSLLSGAAAASVTTTPVARRSDPIVIDDSQSTLRPYKKDPTRPFAHPHYWASFVLIGNWR